MMAGAKKVSVAALSAEIQRMLDDYADDIADGTDEAALAVTNQCLKNIKTASASTFETHNSKKPYAKNWTKRQTETGRGKAQYTIYNRKPGLPHLLENGHAKANGGRVAGRPHIAPAVQTAVQDFQERVEEVIRNAGG